MLASRITDLLPCQEVSYTVLDILECVFFEKAVTADGALSTDDIKLIIKGIAKAPGDLQDLYEVRLHNCMTANEKETNNGVTISNTPSSNPCIKAVDMTLNILESMLLEKAVAADGNLSVDDIKLIIEGVKKAPGDLRKFYEVRFNNCMETAGEIPSVTLHEQLSKAIGDKPKKMSVGHVQSIGLNNIKSILGDRWATLASKVYEISEQHIKQHLDDNDTLTRTEENEFIICFTESSTTESLQRAQNIKRDLSQALLSNEVKDELDNFNLKGTDWEELANVRVQSIEVEVSPEDIKSDDIEKALLRKMAEAAKRLHCDRKKILKSIADNCKVDVRHILKLTKDRTSMARMRLDPESHASALQLIGCSQEKEKEKVIVTLDRIYLLSAATYLYTKNNLLGPNLIIEISLETLNSPEMLSKYIDTCKSFGSEINKKIVFCLTVHCSELNKRSLLNRYKELQPFCSALSIQVNGNTFDYDNFQPTGLSLVIFDYNNFLISIRKDALFLMNLSKYLKKFNSYLLVDNLPYDNNIQELRPRGIKLFTFR